MTSRRRYVFWFTVAVIGAALFMFAVRLRRPLHSARDGSVQVVDVSSPLPKHRSSTIAVSGFPPVSRFDNLTGYQRMSLTVSRTRDVEWSPAAEKRLTSTIEPLMQGLKLDKVYCAQGACQIIGAMELGGRSQDDAVKQLMDGGVQRGLRVAGFVENGSITIDADDDHRLRFYQYMALPGLVK